MDEALSTLMHSFPTKEDALASIPESASEPDLFSQLNSDVGLTLVSALNRILNSEAWVLTPFRPPTQGCFYLVSFDDAFHAAQEIDGAIGRPAVKALFRDKRFHTFLNRELTPCQITYHEREVEHLQFLFK